MTRYQPEIKICGLTREEEAVACAEAGADAIGLVFYPPSPRHLSLQQARSISLALPDATARVGVFVNSDIPEILKTIDECRLTMVQLHGRESPDDVRKIQSIGIPVIKALFIHKAPFISEAANYADTVFLVECGKGRLPGGNALTWNWSEVRSFGRNYPLILAGGLGPDTIGRAVSEALPDAIDVSSGVESVPGRKDIRKVRDLIRSVPRYPLTREVRRIWRPAS